MNQIIIFYDLFVYLSFFVFCFARGYLCISPSVCWSYSKYYTPRCIHTHSQVYRMTDSCIIAGRTRQPSFDVDVFSFMWTQQFFACPFLMDTYWKTVKCFRNLVFLIAFSNIGLISLSVRVLAEIRPVAVVEMTVNIKRRSRSSSNNTRSPS